MAGRFSTLAVCCEMFCHYCLRGWPVVTLLFFSAEVRVLLPRTFLLDHPTKFTPYCLPLKTICEVIDG